MRHTKWGFLLALLLLLTLAVFAQEAEFQTYLPASFKTTPTQTAVPWPWPTVWPPWPTSTPTTPPPTLTPTPSTPYVELQVPDYTISEPILRFVYGYTWHWYVDATFEVKNVGNCTLTWGKVALITYEPYIEGGCSGGALDSRTAVVYDLRAKRTRMFEYDDILVSRYKRSLNPEDVCVTFKIVSPGHCVTEGD